MYVRDAYQTLDMTSEMCFEYNHTSKQQRLICTDCSTKSLFLGRLSTSNQVVGQSVISFTWRYQQPMGGGRKKCCGTKYLASNVFRPHACIYI